MKTERETRERWLQGARAGMEEHGAVSHQTPEHYRNVWTWMDDDDRPASPDDLLPLLLLADSSFGRDVNDIYFWLKEKKQ